MGKTGATLDLFKEAIGINNSLSVLAISALTDKSIKEKKKHHRILFSTDFHILDNKISLNSSNIKTGC